MKKIQKRYSRIEKICEKNNLELVFCGDYPNTLIEVNLPSMIFIANNRLYELNNIFKYLKVIYVLKKAVKRQKINEEVLKIAKQK